MGRFLPPLSLLTNAILFMAISSVYLIFALFADPNPAGPDLKPIAVICFAALLSAAFAYFAISLFASILWLASRLRNAKHLFILALPGMILFAIGLLILTGPEFWSIALVSVFTVFHCYALLGRSP